MIIFPQLFWQKWDITDPESLILSILDKDFAAQFIVGSE